MPRTTRRLPLLGGLILVAACAPAGPGTTPHVADAYGVSLGITNENTRTLEVFAHSNSNVARLGTVQPLQDRVFQIPDRLLDHEPYSIRIVAKPGRDRQQYSTPSLQVRRGERILLRVEEDLGFSTFTIVSM